MKKILAVILTMFITGSFIFADDAAKTLGEINDDANKVDLSMVTIIPEEQHTKIKTAKVKIEYIPMVDEVRIYYTCMYTLYESGEAMNSVMACLQDFTKANRYYHYKYMEKDKERFYKDARGFSWAQYVSHVKLSR